MIDVPALPETIQNVEALLIYNYMLKWLCGILITIVIALVYDRERIRRKREEKDEREIELLKMKLDNERTKKVD